MSVCVPVQYALLIKDVEIYILLNLYARFYGTQTPTQRQPSTVTEYDFCYMPVATAPAPASTLADAVVVGRCRKPINLN